jgi:membrane associated rhomboid family serine protease
MALIGGPQTEADEELAPEFSEIESVVSRLRIVSALVWIACTLFGAAIGPIYVIARSDPLDRTYFATSLEMSVIVAAVAGAAVGCFVGFLASVVFDWARHVVELLDRIARK